MQDLTSHICNKNLHDCFKLFFGSYTGEFTCCASRGRWWPHLQFEAPKMFIADFCKISFCICAGGKLPFSRACIRTTSSLDHCKEKEKSVPKAISQTRNVLRFHILRFKKSVIRKNGRISAGGKLPFSRARIRRTSSLDHCKEKEKSVPKAISQSTNVLRFHILRFKRANKGVRPQVVH